MKKTVFLVILSLCLQYVAFGQNAFITTWQTTTANESIAIPTSGSGYDYTIDWGDGAIEMNQTSTAIHSYKDPGIHTVSISGDFPRINFGNSTANKEKILTIEQWGDIKWATMRTAFFGCINLNITNAAIDSPDLSLVEDMSRMFFGAEKFDGDISNWNVENVTNMASMFQNAETFNGDINNWNVENVTTMVSMFSGAEEFNKDLNKWDVENVTRMDAMFERATKFDGDITNWNVINVTNMSSMFSGAEKFNKDLNNWKVENVTTMATMFSEAKEFNGDISDWKVDKVTDMANMFNTALKFNQNIGSWNVSNVTSMFRMFNLVSSLTQENYDALLIGWSALNLQSNVTFRGPLSKYCTSETQRQSIIDKFNWNITDGGKENPPVITGLTNVNEEGSYTLPAITGVNLSGNEKYYTETLGGGTEYNIGEDLSYDASVTYPITLYAYDSGSGCGVSEESFTLTLTPSKTLNVSDVVLDNISIYTTDNTTLRVTGLTAGNTKAKLFNLLGKEVLSTSFESNGVNDISLPEITTGIYIIQLETEKGKLSKKIILE